jgi:hypothetical protein
MRRALLCLVFSALAMPACALAAQGTAVWVDASCKYFIVDLGGEFGFYHWIDGEPPREGDVLDGEVRSPRRVELVNTTSGGKNGVVAMAISPTMHSLIHSSPAECKRRWQK